jgi:hypothetical protein
VHIDLLYQSSGLPVYGRSSSRCQGAREGLQTRPADGSWVIILQVCIVTITYQTTSIKDHLRGSRLKIAVDRSRQCLKLTILSESMIVCKRCATHRTVTSFLSSCLNESWIAASVSWSTKQGNLEYSMQKKRQFHSPIADVASSRINNLLCRIMALANAMICRCPTDILAPPSEIDESRLIARWSALRWMFSRPAARRASFRAASSCSPNRSRLCRTVPLKSSG